MPTIHLMHGFVGSGKTSYAKRLERELGAFRFTHDEWMVKLYGVDPPQEKFAEYWKRVEELIWEVAARALSLGNDVILDFGFWTRASRDDARQRAKDLGADVKIYSFSCPEELMRARVQQRTAELPEGNLWINDAAFEEFKSRFQPLQDDEEHVVVATT